MWPIGTRLALEHRRISADMPNHANRSNNGKKDGSQPVTRAELEKMLDLVHQRDVIDELRRELHGMCRDLSEDVRRELQTQFTRIAQLQQEIDALKRRT